MAENIMDRNFASQGYTERVFTWVDVEQQLRESAIMGNWPTWLVECDPYWDTLRLIVSENPDDEALTDWLETLFGLGKVIRTDDGIQLLLDGLAGGDSAKRINLEVEQRSENISIRREPRWSEKRVFRELARSLEPPASAFPDDVRIFGMYSFKGGVGRTLHTVALAEEISKNSKVLVVDADLEAPGITWMLSSTGKRIDIGYEDLLSLMHDSVEPDYADAVATVSSYLPNQRFDNTFVLPTRRNTSRLNASRIHPNDLLSPNRSPFVITETLAAVAQKIGAKCVIIDLRAGASEISASVMMDPRVQRVFVTTVSSQSVAGTAIVASELERRSPSDKNAMTIVTQFRANDSQDDIAKCIEPLLEVFADVAPASEGNNLEVQDEGSTLPLKSDFVYSMFREELLALPTSWGEVSNLTIKIGLGKILSEFAKESMSSANTSLDINSATDASVATEQINSHRSMLSQFSDTLVYAETSTIEEFMPTRPLRQMLESHRTELPILVSVGSKGAGKTFTQIQMSYRENWCEYANAVGVDGVIVDAKFVPVLSSKNLSDQVLGKIDRIREKAQMSTDVSKTRIDLLDDIKEGTSQDLSDREWRRIWLKCIAESAGLAVDEHNVERQLADFALNSGENRIFLIDGLEDIFQNIVSSTREQQALRVLLSDCLEWLRSLRGRPIGMIVFVRRDLVRAAIPQNSAQFLAQYQEYALTWNPLEALRLASWVSSKSQAVGSIIDSSVLDASEEELSPALSRLWGEKMGGPNSREARSQGWFLAALSDFNGSIQARDIVLFLKESAEKSKMDTRWTDRLLAPSSMRSALRVCSEKKIEAIGEETPRMAEILSKLRDMSSEKKVVPIPRDSMPLMANEIALLEDSGVVFREDEKYWIPEIFRHGLGFAATGRPRVLSIATLVRSRNNSE